MAGLAGDSSSLTEVIRGKSESRRGMNMPKSEDRRLLFWGAVAVAVAVPVAVGVAIPGVDCAESTLGFNVAVVDNMASSTSFVNSASVEEDEEGGEVRRGERALRREENVVVCGDVYGVVFDGSCANAEAGRRSLADGARFTTAELGRLFPDN